MQDIEHRLQKLDVADGHSLDDPALLTAFRTGASERARALAVTLLARVVTTLVAQDNHDGVASQLLPTLQSSLSSSAEDSQSDYTAALRLLSTLYAIDGQAAALLFLEDGRKLWRACFPKLGDSSIDVDFSRAELLSSATNHAPTRSKLSGNATIRQWLSSAASGGTASSVEARRTAMLSALVAYKLDRSGSSETGMGNSAEDVGTQRSLDPEEVASRQSDLLRLAKCEITGASVGALQAEQTRVTLLAALEGLGHLSASLEFKQSIAGDSTLLSALCNLPGRIGQGASKRAVFPARGDDPSTSERGSSSYEFGGKLATATWGPERADTSMQFALSTIIWNLVAYPASLSREEAQMKKLQSMATAQKGKQSGGVPKSGRETEASENTQAIDARVSRCISAGATKLLVEISQASTGAASTDSAADATIHRSSRRIRQTLSNALLSLTTKQDKALRGRIAQEGGAKALLSLSIAALIDLSQDVEGSEGEDAAPPASVFGAGSSRGGESQTFAPMQGLARLCITASPAILFGSASSALSALPPLAALYLHPATDPLQKFEGLLALTNIASLSPEAGTAVARATLRPGLVSAVANGVAKDAKPTTASPTLLDALETSILLEDNAMIRRAAIELLCNLLQDDKVFKRWSGEEDEEARVLKQQQRQQKDISPTTLPINERTQRRLHLLVALCAPGSVSPPANSASASASASTSTSTSTSSTTPTAPTESALPTRLAASGALAMLSSSPVTCAHLLSLRPRTLNILARLVHPGTACKASERATPARKIREIISDDDGGDDEEDDHGGDDDEDHDEVDETEEATLEAHDTASSPHSPAHARASLALRGISILDYLARYVSWLCDQQQQQQQRGSTADKNAAAAGGSQDSPLASTSAQAKLHASGCIEAIRSAVLHGAAEAQQQRGQQQRREATSNAASSTTQQRETQGMQMEVLQIGMACLKVLG